jgi:hypothetical protein
MNKGSFDGGGLLIILFDLRDAVDDSPHPSKKLELLILLRIDILDIVRYFGKEKICQMEVLDWVVLGLEFF